MAKRPAPPSADLSKTPGFQAGEGDLFNGADERGFFAESRSGAKRPAAIV
jgi:DNA repair protein RadC